MYLRDFTVLRPKFETEQKSALEWMVGAHSLARSRLDKWEVGDKNYEDFRASLSEKLMKLGLGDGKIQRRSSELKDFFHADWSEMDIFNVQEHPTGYMLDKRMDFFNASASKAFETFYPEGSELPAHLIHTTCTGYVAPSPAQKIVSLRNNGKETAVTHAYHMGCYGAMKSVRMGMGHFALEQTPADIVHTEVCTLHFNPTLHSTEQLVVQSLFADGFIKYTLGEAKGPGLKILAVEEEIIENSTEKMTWDCHPSSFKMTISKDIPVLLRRSMKSYLERLMKKAGRSDWKGARFAIHPGGPKIIDQIASHLELAPEQYCHSVEILQNCGNMSSATLPHVWDLMLKDVNVKDGELIVSMAFGPGLSFCGGLFEMVRN
ncbi:MAG: 3-oxoacyl-[acyl-carrier-protein] synthase III C-terminal domain-containing protein [Simkaniaceae bacterium]|nr:3-oxoacyl-[acyl-carrier-protein] synthase III C-terminal domain-containing protein [Candidatus Sacchlamyda saccharinae]